MVAWGPRLLSEIADRKNTQARVAITYAWAIRCPAGVDWSEVNQAIIDRWSVSGLKRIKAEAWKQVERGPGPAGANA